MNKSFFAAGLVSGLLTWATLVFIASGAVDKVPGGPILNLYSILPGLIFGLIIGGMMYFVTAQGRKVSSAVIFVIWSTAAYCAAYNTAFWTAVESVWPGPKEISMYLSFFVAGLLGGFLLAIFLKIFHKIHAGDITRICVWGAVLGLLGCILDVQFKTGFVDKAILFTCTFIVWQTGIAFLMGRAIFFAQNEQVSPVQVQQ